MTEKDIKIVLVHEDKAGKLRVIALTSPTSRKTLSEQLDRASKQISHLDRFFRGVHAPYLLYDGAILGETDFKEPGQSSSRIPGKQSPSRRLVVAGKPAMFPDYKQLRNWAEITPAADPEGFAYIANLYTAAKERRDALIASITIPSLSYALLRGTAAMYDQLSPADRRKFRWWVWDTLKSHGVPLPSSRTEEPLMIQGTSSSSFSPSSKKTLLRAAGGLAGSSGGSGFPAFGGGEGGLPVAQKKPRKAGTGAAPALRLGAKPRALPEEEEEEEEQPAAAPLS